MASLVAQERPEGGPHHPFQRTAVTTEARRSTRVRSCLHLAHGTMGAELAFLAACWFSYSEPEKRRGTQVVSPGGRKVWGISTTVSRSVGEKTSIQSVGWCRQVHLWPGRQFRGGASMVLTGTLPYLILSSTRRVQSSVLQSHTWNTYACVGSMWCGYPLPLAWAKTMSFWFSNVLNQTKSEQVSVLKGKKEQEHKKR